MIAMRESLGMISFISSSCLPLISGPIEDSPVMLPPGRARLAAKPLPTGSVSCAITIGMVDVASLRGRVTDRPARDDEVDFETHEFGDNLTAALGFAF